MTIFLRLLAAHMLTDFIIFRDRVYFLRLGGGFKGSILHSLIYIVCIVILCWPFMGIDWINFGGLKLNGWFMLLPLALLHIGADRFDRSLITGAPGHNTAYFIMWQAISVLVLFLVAPLAHYAEIIYFDKFLLVVIGAIFVTYFLMMLLYFIDKDLSAQEFPIPDERYASMLSRLVLYFLLLIPGYMGWGLGVLWLVFAASTGGVRGFDIPKTRIYVGTPLTVTAAVIVRLFVLYA